MRTPKPGTSPGPDNSHGHDTTAEKLAALRRLVIRARALGDHDREFAAALLLALAEAGEDVPWEVIDNPPAMVAFGEVAR